MSLQVTNLSRGGRSARSYVREGLWSTLVSQIVRGDYVIIEFGHNDGGSVATSDRASVSIAILQPVIIYKYGMIPV